MKQSFWAARPFGYGPHSMLDVGQVIEIEPGQCRNDESLIRLGLLRPIGDAKPVQCGKCGAWFVNERFLNQHGNLHHRQPYHEMGRAEAAQSFDRMGQMEAQLRPDPEAPGREQPDLDLKTAENVGRLKALEMADEMAERDNGLKLALDKSKANQSSAGRRASR